MLSEEHQLSIEVHWSQLIWDGENSVKRIIIKHSLTFYVTLPLWEN